MRDTLTEYQQRAQLLGLSDNTVELRIYLWRQLPAEPQNVTADQLLQLIARPASRVSRRTYAQGLRLGWRAMTQLDLVTGPYQLLNYQLPAKQPPQPMPYSHDEVSRLLTMRDDISRIMSILGTKAGLRVGEVSRLRREDSSAGYLYVRGKMRDERLPISPIVAEAVEEWPMPGYQPGSLARRWRVNAEGVGVFGRFHRCRATYATNLVEAGADLVTTSAALRHRHLTSTAHYVATTDARVAEAVARL